LFFSLPTFSRTFSPVPILPLPWPVPTAGLPIGIFARYEVARCSPPGWFWLHFKEPPPPPKWTGCPPPFAPIPTSSFPRSDRAAPRPPSLLLPRRRLLFFPATIFPAPVIFPLLISLLLVRNTIPPIPCVTPSIFLPIFWPEYFLFFDAG